MLVTHTHGHTDTTQNKVTCTLRKLKKKRTINLSVHSHLSFVPSVRHMARMDPQYYHREGGSVCGLTVVAARPGKVLE